MTCLFAPVGALTRYYLSRRFNVYGWFPWGTFIANMVAVGVLAIMTIMFDTPRNVKLSTYEYATVYGIAQGFCGCLSTVSTWVFELRTLTTVPSRALIYGIVSIASAQAILIVSVGVYRWVHGVEE